MKTIIQKTFKGLFYLKNMGYHRGNILTFICALLFIELSFSDVYNQKIWLLWLTFIPIPIGHLLGAYKRTIEDQKIEEWIIESRIRTEEYFQSIKNFHKEGLNNSNLLAESKKN